MCMSAVPTSSHQVETPTHKAHKYLNWSWKLHQEWTFMLETHWKCNLYLILMCYCSKWRWQVGSVFTRLTMLLSLSLWRKNSSLTEDHTIEPQTFPCNHAENSWKPSCERELTHIPDVQNLIFWQTDRTTLLLHFVNICLQHPVFCFYLSVVAGLTSQCLHYMPVHV